MGYIDDAFRSDNNLKEWIWKEDRTSLEKALVKCLLEVCKMQEYNEYLLYPDKTDSDKEDREAIMKTIKRIHEEVKKLISRTRGVKNLEYWREELIEINKCFESENKDFSQFSKDTFYEGGVYFEEINHYYDEEYY